MPFAQLMAVLPLRDVACSLRVSDDPKQQGLQRRIQSFSHQQRPENLVISAAFGDAECLAEGWVPL